MLEFKSADNDKSVIINGSYSFSDMLCYINVKLPVQDGLWEKYFFTKNELCLSFSEINSQYVKGENDGYLKGVVHENEDPEPILKSTTLLNVLNISLDMEDI